MLRISGPVLAIAIGYAAAALFGLVSWPDAPDAGWLVLPEPLKAGLSFQWELLLPFGIIYLVSSIESIGDLSATASLSGMATDGPTFWRRLRGGIFSDALATTLATLLSAFPTSTFSQNNGVIQLTGVGSRQVGFYVAAILVVCAVMPQTGIFFSAIPKPVLGGVTLILFGLIAGAGLRMIHQVPLGNREVLVLAISLGMGFGIPSQDALVESLPPLLGSIFSSSVATGGLTAVVMNFIYLRKDKVLGPSEEEV